MSKDLITYCPGCFSPSLTLKGNGIVMLIVNEKKMDNGRFLYDTKDTPQELKMKFIEKLEEFFKWYSKFYNIEPITKLQLTSNNFECTANHCIIKPNFQISVIGILIPKETVLDVVKKKGEEYNIEINLKLE